MSIKALPAETTRLLDASSLIANSVSLVKELVDNAIDAHATSIEVFLAPNTVDKIEVRDDGHGILRADFAALGRPGHTSKLTSLDDLHTRTAEAASLGFRGQGLAAATALGYVAITTRTRDEPVAAAFRLASGGGGIVSDSLKSAAAPVGTSVAVTCLFSLLPVRRRAAVQDASKTIAAVKALLCGYALARPQLRLAFRVFQQQPPLVWQYHCRCLVSSTPSSTPPSTPSTAGADVGTEMRESVRVLFGNEVARQCQDVVVSAAELLPAPGHGNQSTLEHALVYASQGHERLRELVFEVLLPQPGADLSKLAVGGFVSVDGRPLSARHRGGMAGKLLAVFRKHLSSAIRTLPLLQRHVREAFLRLNIRCPAGSYDPNVEAAKTDVLFANEKLVCDAFEKLCVHVYGAAEEQSSHMRPGNLQTPVTGRSFRPVAIPHSPTPAGRTVRSVANPSDQASPIEPTGTGQRILLGRVSRPRGVQRRGLAAQRQRFSHARPVGNSQALQTPPPSSPLEGYRGVRAQGARRRAESPGHGDLPGLVSNDGYRQTTILFGRPPSRARPERGTAAGGSCTNPQTLTAGREFQRTRETSGIPGPARTQEIQGTEDLAPAKTAMVQHPVGEPVDTSTGNAKADAGLRTTRGNNGVGRARGPGAARRNAVYVLEADLAKLERAYTRFVSDGVQRGEELGHLSADSDDLSAVKQRLRQAITGWLAQRRANGKGSGPVEVEMYVKRGLKGKTKMTRRLSHGMGRVSHAS